MCWVCETFINKNLRGVNKYPVYKYKHLNNAHEIILYWSGMCEEFISQKNTTSSILNKSELIYYKITLQQI